MIDEIAARIAWSILADPGDTVASNLVAHLGFTLSYDVVSATSQKARSALCTLGLSTLEAEATATRWQTRLQEVDRTLAVITRLRIRVNTPEEFGIAPTSELAPTIIYSIGDLSLLEQSSLTVSAEDHPSPSSHELVHAFIPPLSIDHTIIASDRAGDVEIHRATIARGGSSIAVFGGGVDRVARRMEARLFRQVYEQGLIVSATPPGVDLDSSSHVRQEDLLTALSRRLLILGAEKDSFTTRIGRRALQRNAAVGVVAGNALSPSFAGCVDLLHNGAHLISSPAEAHAFASSMRGGLPHV